MRIAVLITCFNRREHTFGCLKKLFDISDSNLDVYLLDDNSTDGTRSLIAKNFSRVKILNGNGNCYWNRGMHIAWKEASKGNYDFYMWLNDDVILKDHAFDELLYCSRISNHSAVISGLIESKTTQEIIYGGSDKKRSLIKSNGFMQPIQFMNGNVVLVPKIIFDKVGNLDPIFHHDLGDVDYGLRSIKNGFKVYSTRTAIGVGESNLQCRVRQQDSSLNQRFKKLYSPLGSNPLINFHFRKRHYGFRNAGIYFLFQHFLNLIPDSLNKGLFGNRYLIR